MEQGRDYWWHDLMALPMARATGGGNRCDTEVMDAEDPLFMLYTSGTTGKPKAILHTHGGYMVGVATTLKMGVRPERRRPLLVRRRPGLDHRPLVHRLWRRCCSGATSFMYEGAPTYPLPEPLVEHGREVRHQRALHARRPRSAG